MNNTPSTEERIWAVLAHLSALALGIGIILPVIGWSDQRRKSNYASLQCLQALGYQSLGYTIWTLFSAVAGIFFFITTLPALSAAREPKEVGILVSKFVMLMFGLLSIYVLLPIIAAISCALGKNFHYPILGRRLVRYLTYESTEKPEEQKWLNESREFQWVAAMGHFSILVILWGMLAPTTAWILQGKYSLFLRLQSIQTLVYQAGVTLLFLGGGLIAALGSVALPLLSLSMFAMDPSSSLAIVGFIIFIALMLFLLVIILLIVPAFHILGQWAGYRVLKGEDYRYPLIGRFVERWIAPHASPVKSEGPIRKGASS